jgi:hypothetical protein
MSRVSEEIRRFAEEPDHLLPEPSPPGRQIRDERFVVSLGAAPWMTFVTRLRTTPEGLGRTVADVRSLVAEAGYQRAAWAIGPSCRPTDLTERLVALGFVPADAPGLEPTFTAMALVRPPDAGTAVGVTVRRVDTFEDYRFADRVLFAGSGVSDDELAAFEASAPTRWESYVSRGVSLRFLASIDDEPVAAGQCLVTELGLFLSGSTTLPEARGRGAYRALVQARWDEAVGRGTPALVIGAGAMSRPILERVGFEPLCQLNVLLDPATEPELEPEPGPSDPGAATS